MAVCEIVVEEINLAAVFGVAFGFYLITNLDQFARDALTFVKGWRNVT